MHFRSPAEKKTYELLRNFRSVKSEHEFAGEIQSDIMDF